MGSSIEVIIASEALIEALMHALESLSAVAAELLRIIELVNFNWHRPHHAAVYTSVALPPQCHKVDYG